MSLALGEGDLASIKQIIGERPRLAYTTFSYGQPILTMAIKLSARFGRDDSIAEWLMRHGADVEQVNRNGATPLFEAAYRGRLDIAMKLIRAGAMPWRRARGFHFLSNVVFGAHDASRSERPSYYRFLDGLVETQEWRSTLLPEYLKTAATQIIPDARLTRHLADHCDEHDSIRACVDRLTDLGVSLTTRAATHDLVFFDDWLSDAAPCVVTPEDLHPASGFFSGAAAGTTTKSSLEDFALMEDVPHHTSLVDVFTYLVQLRRCTPAADQIGTSLANDQVVGGKHYTFLAPTTAASDVSDEYAPLHHRHHLRRPQKYQQQQQRDDAAAASLSTERHTLKWQGIPTSSNPRTYGDLGGISGKPELTRLWIVSRTLNNPSLGKHSVGRRYELLLRQEEEHRQQEHDDGPAHFPKFPLKAKDGRNYRYASQWSLVMIRPKVAATHTRSSVSKRRRVSGTSNPAPGGSQ